MPKNRITQYLKGCPEDMLVDACQAFCEEREEVDRLKEEALSAIDGLVMLKNGTAIREVAEMVRDAAVHVAKLNGVIQNDDESLA